MILPICCRDLQREADVGEFVFAPMRLKHAHQVLCKCCFFVVAPLSVPVRGQLDASSDQVGVI